MTPDQPQTSTPISDAMRTGGQWNPNWDPIAEVDPLWIEKFMAMGIHPMKHLDAKTIEFLAIAVDASCTHMYGPGGAATSARPWSWAPRGKKSRRCCS